MKQYAAINNESDLKIILDCETRWNSTYEMLKVAIKLKKSLTQQAEKETFIEISDDDWKNVSLIIDILEPFKVATEEICGDKHVLMSQLYPVFITIKDHLNDCEKQNKYFQYKCEIQQMNVKYDQYWEIMKPLAIIANGSDPRFKMDLMNRADKLYFSNKLEEIYTHYFNKSTTIIQSPTNSSQSSTSNRTLTLTEQLLIKKKLISTSADEIENYVSSPRASLKTETLHWWQRNKKSYPVLSDIAKDYLSSAPSSTASERSFSTSGNIITIERSNLLTEKAAKLVQLWSWNKEQL